MRNWKKVCDDTTFALPLTRYRNVVGNPRSAFFSLAAHRPLISREKFLFMNRVTGKKGQELVISVLTLNLLAPTTVGARINP